MRVRTVFRAEMEKPKISPAQLNDLRNKLNHANGSIQMMSEQLQLKDEQMAKM